MFIEDEEGMHMNRNLKDRKEISMQLYGVQEFLVEQLSPRVNICLACSKNRD